MIDGYLAFKNKNMQRIKVKITNDPAGSWYEEHLGKEFFVYPWGTTYVLQVDYDHGYENMWRHIEKSDCQVIEESPQPTPNKEEGKVLRLDLDKFSDLNRNRAAEGFKTYKNVPITYWTTALAGEVGELCNMIKKQERVAHGGIDGGSSYTAASLTPEDLKEEIGGIFIYLDLLSGLLGIDLTDAIIHTFNSKSEKYGFAQKYIPETPSPLKEIEWDSRRLIGRVRDRFRELIKKGWDWRSFYNGWLEGRADMFAQNKGIAYPNELPAEPVPALQGEISEEITAAEILHKHMLGRKNSYMHDAMEEYAQYKCDLLYHKMQEEIKEYRKALGEIQGICGTITKPLHFSQHTPELISNVVKVVLVKYPQGKEGWK